jgi:hypothetical protein
MMPLPTTAEPGSPNKVAVMRQRYAEGEQIFHPHDPRIEWELATMNSLSISLYGLSSARCEWDRAISEIE